METNESFEYLRQFYNPYHGRDGRFTTSRGGAVVVPWGSPSGRGKPHPGAASGAYASARAAWKPRGEGGTFISKSGDGSGKKPSKAMPGPSSEPASKPAPKSEWQIREDKLAARRMARKAPQGMGMDRERGGSKRTPSGQNKGIGGWAEAGLFPNRAPAESSGSSPRSREALQRSGIPSDRMAEAARQKTLQGERQAAREAAARAKLSDRMAEAARQLTLRRERDAAAKAKREKASG